MASTLVSAIDSTDEVATHQVATHQNHTKRLSTFVSKPDACHGVDYPNATGTRKAASRTMVAYTIGTFWHLYQGEEAQQTQRVKRHFTKCPVAQWNAVLRSEPQRF